MNFLVCDVAWAVDGSGYPVCPSGFRTVTTEEARTLLSVMSWDDVAAYKDEIVVLFAVVFGFLALRKALL